MAAEAIDLLRGRALERGFLRLGVAAAGPARSQAMFEEWLAAGRHGDMKYLERSRADRADVGHFLPAARAVVVVTAAYSGEEPSAHAGLVGRIARYARARDYHKGLRRALVDLARLSDRLVPGSRSRIFLDTGPVFEREWAVRAGLGAIGKNGCLIDPEHGSWILIGGFATTAAYPASEEAAPADPCGSCRRCVDACPTAAFVEPGVVDARRCISYLTIEHRGPIDEALLPAIAPNLFGCDVCQEVCPWNEAPSPPIHPRLRPRPDLARVDLAEAADWGRDDWERVFAGSPVRRPGYLGFVRSLAAVLGGAGERRRARELLDRLVPGGPGVAETLRWAKRRLEE